MAKKFTSKSKPIQKKATEPKQVVDTGAKEIDEIPVTEEDQKTEESATSSPQGNTNNEIKIEEETEILEEESKNQDQNQPLIENIPLEQTNKKNYKILILGLLVATAIAVLVSGYFYWQSKKEIPQPSPTPTTVKTEEKTYVFNRSDWSIEVLNGSTKAGAASKLAKDLETLGYKITKTGNADNKDYKNSSVALSTDIKKYKAVFLGDLDGKITLSETTETQKDSTASAQIIIGLDE